MYSSRLNWGAQPNPISELLDSKHREGAQVLDLTQSNPTHAAIAYPAEGIAAAFDDPRVLHYDPAAFGLASAREIVSGYYAEQGVTVEPSRISLTASTSEAYSWLFKLLADPGDEILAPRPSYPLFEFLAQLESVRMVQYPLFYDHGWHVDMAGLEALLTPRSRAIVVVNPNNPTGSYLKRKEFDSLVELCRKHDLALICDEVFSDYALGDAPDRVRTIAGESGFTGFALNGLSKIVGLPQMKLGWIVATEPSSLERLELIADSYLSVGTPVQVALPQLMAARRGIQSQINGRTRSNLALLKAKVTAGARFDVLAVEGGWYAILRVPRIRTELDWVLGLLRDHNVLVQPGYFYDFESEAYLVLSLLTEPSIFEAGVTRVIESIESATIG